MLLAAGAGKRYGQPKALVDTGSGPWLQRGLEVLSHCEPLLVVLGAGSAAAAALVPAGVHIVENPRFAEGMGSSLRVGLTVLAKGLGPAQPGASGGVAAKVAGTEARGLSGMALAGGELAGFEVLEGVGVRGEVLEGGTPEGETLEGGTLEGERAVDAVLVMLVDLPGIGPAVIRRVLAAAGSPAQARSMLARAAFSGIPGHPVLLGRDHWTGVIGAAVGDRGARDYLRTRRVTFVECGDIGSGHDVDEPS